MPSTPQITLVSPNGSQSDLPTKSWESSAFLGHVAVFPPPYFPEDDTSSSSGSDSSSDFGSDCDSQSGLLLGDFDDFLAAPGDDLESGRSQHEHSPWCPHARGGRVGGGSRRVQRARVQTPAPIRNFFRRISTSELRLPRSVARTVGPEASEAVEEWWVAMREVFAFLLAFSLGFISFALFLSLFIALGLLMGSLGEQLAKSIGAFWGADGDAGMMCSPGQGGVCATVTGGVS